VIIEKKIEARQRDNGVQVGWSHVNHQLKIEYTTTVWKLTNVMSNNWMVMNLK